MPPIFLASVTPYAGKNVVALGLAEKLRSQNKTVGYFKPIGPLPVHVDGVKTDEDAVFFKKILGLDDSLESLCPLVLSNETMTDLMSGVGGNVKEDILSAFKRVAEGKDVVLAVNMGRLSCGLSLGYPMHKFAKDVGAKVIVVDRYRWPMETLDGIIHIKNLVPELFAGVIFNRIPIGMTKRIEEEVQPFLKKHGVDVCGVVPDDAMLSAIPVRELVEALGGKVLCCEDNLDALVEHFSIGAMKVESAQRFFQRVPNKAVITGGDRADILIAALQSSTRCLILTGNISPNERILVKAEELGVPVILVAQDTSSTVEICDRLHGHLSLNSERKIERIRELLDKCVNWDLLWQSCGLS